MVPVPNHLHSQTTLVAAFTKIANVISATCFICHSGLSDRELPQQYAFLQDSCSFWTATTVRCTIAWVARTHAAASKGWQCSLPYLSIPQCSFTVFPDTDNVHNLCLDVFFLTLGSHTQRCRHNEIAFDQHFMSAVNHSWDGPDMHCWLIDQPTMDQLQYSVQQVSQQKKKYSHSELGCSCRRSTPAALDRSVLCQHHFLAAQTCGIWRGLGSLCQKASAESSFWAQGRRGAECWELQPIQKIVPHCKTAKTVMLLSLGFHDHASLFPPKIWLWHQRPHQH